MRFRANLRPVIIAEKGRFRPEGRPRTHGTVSGMRPLAGRFLPSFHVDGKPRWTEDDLIKFFVEIRDKRPRSAGAGFLTQRGIWQLDRGRQLTTTVEFDLEKDGRHIAEVLELPGCLAYGQTHSEADTRVRELASQIRADQPDEEGAQILVMNEREFDEKGFFEVMAPLAEDLALRMDQDLVFLEIQKSGQVIGSYAFSAGP
jgi:hypothetical protein